jgi:hypothetical protein
MRIIVATQVAKELAEARMDVESCDRLIKKYDSRLRPELIEPIRRGPVIPTRLIAMPLRPLPSVAAGN